MSPSRVINRMLTITCGFAIALLLTSGQFAFAQSDPPVVRASSKTASIRDGKHFKKGYWAIMPERKPDYYYAEIPEKAHTISFITDLDSIAFDVTYGKEYDFIILLNGKDSCFTRISARYNNFNASMRKTTGAGPDTIPFTLGDNHKVYVNAKLNDAEVTNIQLDLGAGGILINKTSVKKVKMNFNGQVTLTNSDGVNQVPFASKNFLQIGNLVWDSVSIAVANNMKDHEDLLIGNSLFKDKILEVNYDKKILVVHDTLPPQITAYSRHDVILDGGVIPYITVNLTIRGKTQTGWVMFDTGARTSILNSTDVPIPYRIVNELAAMIGLDGAMKPKLSIGNYRLSEFEYKTRNMGGEGLNMILGSDLLKRFNLVLDNKNGYLYMQPNSLTKAPYRQRDEYYVVRMVTGLVILLAGIVMYRKMRKKYRPQT
ncbi:aspartyl protease family protein [Mucilaginibacter sabulilitoris]|uniref:Aspartyl protease family protein n=1 Tax=Mucilaginibacter sabulilitoris TaxID=1173583 RepID=A0ABZ0TRF8_9SPHI|nr:aspartyl protease family protein [Mucilaginibacter sabulilitoris]WPU95713.1 aspartyl protease family protein [Mucilaginibacter sabulilitoris]